MYLVLFIDIPPFPVKGQRIDQIHNRVPGRRLFQQFLNHAVGFLLYPAVDVIPCARVKGSLKYRCIVIIPAGFKKILIYSQAVPVPEPYGIRYVDLAGLAVGHIICVCLQIIIQDSRIRMHHLFHLRPRAALRSICSHSQGGDNGKRRNQAIAMGQVFTQKFQRKFCKFLPWIYRFIGWLHHIHCLHFFLGYIPGKILGTLMKAI